MGDVMNLGTLPPVNYAKPQWRCPYCGTDYHADLESAEKCAALGPATADGAAERVAVWDHGHDRGGYGKPAELAIVHLEGVKLDGPSFTWDRTDAERRHVQTYSNGMMAVEGVGYVEGTLIEHGGETRGGYLPSSFYGIALEQEFNDLADLKRWYESSNPKNGVRHITHGRDLTPRRWLGPITPEVATTFEILMPRTWEHLADIEARNKTIERHFDGDRQYRWRGWTSAHHYNGFHKPREQELAALAMTHGFELRDDVGMSRWEFTHRDLIDSSFWERACAWVDRDGVTPMVESRINLSIKVTGHGGELPRLPGKRRVADLAHWGVEYFPGDDRWYDKVLEAAIASLVVEPPDLAVPGAPTADEFSARMSRKARR